MRVLVLLCAAAVVVGAACSSGHPTGASMSSGAGTGTGGGGGGEGGACPTGPEAMFEVTITAAEGPVPRTTTVDVSWSAGQEPTFALDLPTTWMTLDQANIVCDVDATKPPPEHLPALLCHLWTTGATHVVVGAKGYTTFEDTFTSTYSDHCQSHVPTAVSIKLEPVPVADAGAK